MSVCNVKYIVWWTTWFIRDFCIPLTLWVYQNFTTTAAINTHDASSAHWVKGNWSGLAFIYTVVSGVYGTFLLFWPLIMMTTSHFASSGYSYSHCHHSSLMRWKTILYLLYGKFNSINLLQYYIWDHFLFLTNSYLYNSYISMGWKIADDPEKEQSHVS